MSIILRVKTHFELMTAHRKGQYESLSEDHEYIILDKQSKSRYFSLNQPTHKHSRPLNHTSSVPKNCFCSLNEP